MNFKHITVFAAALLFSFTLHAQTAGGTQVNSTSNSQVSSGASSSSSNMGNAQQAQQAITFNSPAQPTRTTTRVESAPNMGLGSFGSSFSTDNCSNAIAGAVSVVGFGASAGRAVLEQNCAHLRRGYAFGQAAAFAHSIGQEELARKFEAMVGYEFCLSAGTDSDTAKGCAQMGLIQLPGAKQDDSTPSPAVAIAVQQREQAVQPSQLSPAAQAVVDESKLSNQRWYQNAEAGAVH